MAYEWYYKYPSGLWEKKVPQGKKFSQRKIVKGVCWNIKTPLSFLSHLGNAKVLGALARNRMKTNIYFYYYSSQCHKSFFKHQTHPCLLRIFSDPAVDWCPGSAVQVRLTPERIQWFSSHSLPPAHRLLRFPGGSGLPPLSFQPLHPNLQIPELDENMWVLRANKLSHLYTRFLEIFIQHRCRGGW